MRTYARNSPEVAARIVAVLLISDGHVCRSEIYTLDALHIEHELELAPGGFGDVIHALCEDLLAGSCSSGAMLGRLDDATLASFLADVQAPALRHQVLRLNRAAAAADRHLANAETIVLAAIRRHWQISDDGAEAPASRPALQAA